MMAQRPVGRHYPPNYVLRWQISRET